MESDDGRAGGRLLLAGCSFETDEASPRPGDKPAEAISGEWVKVFDDDGGWGLKKRCDGTTLVYRDGTNSSVAVIPNSPECTKPETPSSSAP